jgi:hypothetical protein
MFKLGFILSAFGVAVGPVPLCFAQPKLVTLPAGTAAPANYAVTTNQVVQILAVAGLPDPALVILHHKSGISAATTNAGSYTGLTNISVVQGSHWEGGGLNSSYGLATFTVTTPTDPVMTPSTGVVIPSDATGPVQIRLESSADLVNWTDALPGTYGASSTNRFFRVRAVVATQ